MITGYKSPQSYLGEYSLFGKFESFKEEPIIRKDILDNFSLLNKYSGYSKLHAEIDVSIESFYRIFNSIDKIPLIEKVLSSRSTEGFIDTVKSIAKKVIRAIILAVKAVISWLKTYLLAFGRFVRDKIFHKIFGSKKTRETLVNLVKAYDKYSDTSICNPFNNNKSKEAYDTEVSHNDDDIPPLSDNLREALRYMNYKEDNFDIIGRTASTAIDSMILALKKSKDENGNSIFVRNYQVRYGDEEEENEYLEEKRNNPLTTLSLYFYHEKSFMQFIYHIDKLTNGNISALIKDRLYYKGNRNVSTIELKIDLNIKGSDVAKAIILKCSLDKLKDIENKAQNIDTDKIKVKDVISKEVLLRIVAGDSIILDKLQHESEYSLRACGELDIVYKDFEQRLLKYEQQLEKSDYKAIGKYIGVQEANTWINFTTTFIQTFMTYRTNMIHVIRRIIKILAKKSKEEQFVNFGKNTNVPISTRLYGPIRRLDENQWKSLSYQEIMKDSKDIMNRHLINMHYNNKIPIIIIPIRESNIADCKIIGMEGNSGICSGIYNVPNNQKIKNIIFYKLLNAFQKYSTEKELIDAYKSYLKELENLKAKYSECELIGCIIIIKIDLYEQYIDMLKYEKINIYNYFSPSVLYYATIIHETTHAVQQAYNIKTLSDDFYNIAANNTDLETKKINNDNKEFFEGDIADITKALAYNVSPLNEREAFKEESNFLMSTIAEGNNAYKEEARFILRKLGRYITRINLNY